MPNLGKRATPLTEADIIEMRRLRAETDVTLPYLAWLFETVTANVHLIVTGQTHRKAGGPITPVKKPTTESQVLEIRHLRVNEGWSYRRLAEKFGKSEVALRCICSGKTFPGIGGPRVPGRTRGNS